MARAVSWGNLSSFQKWLWQHKANPDGFWNWSFCKEQLVDQSLNSGTVYFKQLFQHFPSRFIIVAISVPVWAVLSLERSSVLCLQNYKAYRCTESHLLRLHIHVDKCKNSFPRCWNIRQFHISQEWCCTHQRLIRGRRRRWLRKAFIK